MIVSGLGNAKLLRKQGYQNALELDWGEHTQVGPATVHFVECHHRSGRGAFDQMKTLWGSFVAETPEGAIYFAGDTGYSPHFKAQGEQHGPFALSLLPIGAYEPRWFRKISTSTPAMRCRRTWTSIASKALAFTLGCFSLPGRRSTPPLRTLRPRWINRGCRGRRFGFWSRVEMTKSARREKHEARRLVAGSSKDWGPPVSNSDPRRLAAKSPKDAQS